MAQTISYWVDLGILGDKELFVDYTAKLVDSEQRLWEIEVHSTSTFSDHTPLPQCLIDHLQTDAAFAQTVLDVERVAESVEPDFEAYLDRIACEGCEE